MRFEVASWVTTKARVVGRIKALLVSITSVHAKIVRQVGSGNLQTQRFNLKCRRKGEIDDDPNKMKLGKA